MCKMISAKDWQAKLQHVYSQLRQIKHGPGEIDKVRVRCECRKRIQLLYAYKCLYCEAYFCKACAEIHFGQTVEQYRREHPIEATDCFVRG